LDSNIVFSADGKLLVDAAGGQVAFWDVDTGQQQGTLNSISANIHSVAINPDGTLLAAAGERTVEVWDVAQRQRKALVSVPPVNPSYRPQISSVAFSPDGRLLLLSDFERICQLWAVASKG
jgi:WD40 repeat protein